MLIQDYIKDIYYHTQMKITISSSDYFVRQIPLNKLTTVLYFNFSALNVDDMLLFFEFISEYPLYTDLC
jgi:GH18 family chitinase